MDDLDAAVGQRHTTGCSSWSLGPDRLNRLHQIERLALKAQKQITAEALRTHEGIARAIEDGDGAAWDRIRRHLEALGALMR